MSQVHYDLYVIWDLRSTHYLESTHDLVSTHDLENTHDLDSTNDLESTYVYLVSNHDLENTHGLESPPDLVSTHDLESTHDLQFLHGLESPCEFWSDSSEKRYGRQLDEENGELVLVEDDKVSWDKTRISEPVLCNLTFTHPSSLNTQIVNINFLTGTVAITSCDPSFSFFFTAA